MGSLRRPAHETARPPARPRRRRVQLRPRPGLVTDPRVDPADLAAIDLRPGASEQSVPLPGGARLSFLLDVPAGVGADRNPAEPVPLVIAMPYAGDPVPSARQYFEVLAQPGLAALGAIVVVPVAFTETWTTLIPVETVASFVEAAAEAWPIDPDRVVVTGYSNGGNGAWAQATLHPDLFSAAIPMASFAPTDPPTALPLYIVHGENDELFPVGRARAAAAAAEQAGVLVEIETPPFAHFEAGRYADALARAAAWVEAEVWDE